MMKYLLTFYILWWFIGMFLIIGTQLYRAIKYCPESLPLTIFYLIILPLYVIIGMINDRKTK